MRPREKYLLGGGDGMSDDELICLVLGSGCAGHPVEHIAKDLLLKNGGLRGLSRLPVSALAAFQGIGGAQATRLHAAMALSARAIQQKDMLKTVSGAEEAATWFRPRMSLLPQEELHGLFLNRRNAVLRYQVLTKGNDAHTIVDPKQVFRAALLVNASAVIVAHNHPSGDPTPSGADLEVSRRLVDAGSLLGVELLDHIVIGGEKHCSLREAGLLRPHGCAAQIASG